MRSESHKMNIYRNYLANVPKESDTKEELFAKATRLVEISREHVAWRARYENFIDALEGLIGTRILDQIEMEKE